MNEPIVMNAPAWMKHAFMGLTAAMLALFVMLAVVSRQVDKRNDLLDRVDASVLAIGTASDGIRDSVESIATDVIIIRRVAESVGQDQEPDPEVQALFNNINQICQAMARQDPMVVCQ